ncbi:hypothetical protein GENT5_17210 [Flavobacterium ammoniigenes]|uniref:Uncharacterized protein n=1 Tax=Flavobacterium ammoniigenes TaxID=1751095 RepID=A0ABM7V771_9FLAO|nr:hypothetical protein GENT5_17210 [Flavobacterium ammoniigenes]
MIFTFKLSPVLETEWRINPIRKFVLSDLERKLVKSRRLYVICWGQVNFLNENSTFFV